MNIYYLISILLISFLCFIFIGNKASKDIQTNDDYFMMRRGITFFPLSMTFFATIFGGGVLIGSAQMAYANGWAVIAYPIGALLGFLMLASGFGAKLRKLNIATIPEIFEAIYASPFLRTLAAIITIFSLYAVLVAQGIAIKSFFVTVGIDNLIYFLLFWFVFVGYTTMGGLKAVVNTDVLQAVFIIIVLVFALFSIELNHILSVVQASKFTNFENIPWSLWMLMPLCYTLIGQDIGQRCFASTNSKIITPAALFSGMLLLLCSFIAIVFGLLANSLQMDIPENANVLLISVKTLTSPTITTLFVACIIMTITSTADSILCAISSNICIDFKMLRNFKPKKQITFSKIITCVLGISALLFIILFDNVIDVLMLSYEFSVSTLFIPIVMAIMLNNPSKIGAIAAIASGMISFVSFKLINTEYPKELITILISLFFYMIPLCVDQFIIHIKRMGVEKNK